MASYSAAAEKTAVEDAAFAAEEKRAVDLEAEMNAAEARLEAAESRYQLACKQVAEELAKPLTEPAAERKPGLSGDGPSLVQMEASVPSDDIGPDAVSRGAKNTSTRTEKEKGSDKWLANKAADERVRDKKKKLREKVRRGQRDERMEFQAEDGGDVGEEAPVPVAAKPPAPVPTERSPLFESDEVKRGAKSLAERLVSLKDRTNAAEKRAAALNVLTGGRESYFTFVPIDVLADLESRGLVEASLASEIRGHLMTQPAKTAPIPPAEWLAHAQKVSGVERKDDQPFNGGEVQYLKWVDRVGQLSAEAELDAAQQKLEELLRFVDASVGVEDAADAKYTAASADQAIDEDYAAQLEAKFDPERQSKGSKNTSALSDKVASKEKWERDRGSDNKKFENNVKAREARRGEARDVKVGAADVDS